MMDIMIGLSVGLGVGYLFFKALQWSVDWILRSSHAWAIMLTSMVIRFALVLSCGVLLLKTTGVKSILAFLIGFTAVKIFTSIPRRTHAKHGVAIR